MAYANVHTGLRCEIESEAHGNQPNPSHLFWRGNLFIYHDTSLVLQNVGGKSTPYICLLLAHGARDCHLF